jgi:hypothetical protein
MTEQPPQKMLVRIPADIKRWLERKAQRNLSSQASEVVRCLRARMDAELRSVG